ncbi:MAG: hypothetical protein KF690_05675 [Bacteroidetes bacterium]|nr:hypothetical protein [Bacteroidota bacterium]
MLTRGIHRTLAVILLWLGVLPTQAAVQTPTQPTKPQMRDTLLKVAVHLEAHTLKVEVEHPTAAFVMVELYNAQGIRVYEQMLPLQAGKDYVSLNLGSLEDGPVLVRCNTTEKFAPQDILLQKNGNALTQR